jgi:RHS repeat-associated protein
VHSARPVTTGAAYGKTIGTQFPPSNVPSPWRFQGRILESTAGSATYDFAARAYVPDLGTFTSLDSVAGGVMNPLSLNRYLYANANPETLVDPDGHCLEDLCIVEGSLAIGAVIVVGGVVIQSVTNPVVQKAEGDALNSAARNINSTVNNAQNNIVHAVTIPWVATQVATNFLAKTISNAFNPPTIRKRLDELPKIKLASPPNPDSPFTPGDGPLKNLPPWIPKNAAKLLTLGAAFLTTVAVPILCALGETGDYECNGSGKPYPTPTWTPMPTSTPAARQPWIPSPTEKPKTLGPSRTPIPTSTAAPSTASYSWARQRIQ